jgi:CP family cyanate transporter-like MFS transporter
MALLITAVFLLALELRACITAVGPLAGVIRGETGLSSTLTGLLTTLPLIAFGAVSPLAPALSRRWGIEVMLFISLLSLAAGIFLRSSAGVSFLFLGTAVLGASIAIGNVLVPALIKRDFPHRIGLMTAIYSTLVGLSGALADGVSIPLAQNAGLGWRGSLAFWALPAVLTALLWLPLLRSRTRTEVPTPGADKHIAASVWRSPLAWQVTLYMGLQSWAFYSVVAWFPTIFEGHGLSAANAGWLLSLIQGAGAFGAFFAPQIAVRMRSQRALVVSTILLALIALVGILSGAFSFILLWCILLGLAQGSFLGIALLFFILRTSDARSAAELSGMAQSVGYLLAATGPLIIGWLHDLTNGWTIPLLVLVVVILLLLGVGIGAGRNATVRSPDIVELRHQAENPPL